ncbi:hypothetical protein Tco_0593179 [Tanacetum coccineum]
MLAMVVEYQVLVRIVTKQVLDMVIDEPLGSERQLVVDIVIVGPLVYHKNVVVHEVGSKIATLRACLAKVTVAGAGTGDEAEKYQEGLVEIHAENVESHPHNEVLWNKVTPPNSGKTFGAYNASDPIFLLTEMPCQYISSTNDI